MNQRTGAALLWFAGLCLVLSVVVGLGHCQAAQTITEPMCGSEIGWCPVPAPKPHFWQKHPTRTKVLAAIGVGSLGLVAHVLTTHNCAKMYDGKPYSGTPPCPK